LDDIKAWVSGLSQQVMDFFNVPEVEELNFGDVLDLGLKG